ncbi:MAG: hypothetical protein MRY49_00640 [Candidatus Pacebacteria bacterium]|nr:hypothetical protein [Candidatus Paceibacterota bacterium]
MSNRLKKLRRSALERPRHMSEEHREMLRNARIIEFYREEDGTDLYRIRTYEGDFVTETIIDGEIVLEKDENQAAA